MATANTAWPAASTAAEPAAAYGEPCVRELTDGDIAYGRWNSTPVRWDCRLP
ncbi:hypothetical protein ACWC0A_09020 [Streptomyces scopuliridis]